MISCLLKNEPASYRVVHKFKPIKGVDAGKPSVKARNQYYSIDPKPGDLSMSRVNPFESCGEGPNPCQMQLAGMTCGSE